MNQQAGPQESLVLSYLSLRKAVGMIGVMLPFVLAFGNMILKDPGIKCSISLYYYTKMGNVFVGSLCAIGVFMLSTRGYDRRDRIAGYLACIFAVGVALFPTSPECVPTAKLTGIGIVHLSSATLLFLTLAFFCFALFTQSDRKVPTRRKLQRNRVYRISGFIILACISLIAVVSLPGINTAVEQLKPVFWLESLAVVTFGVAWLTKGEMILKDEESAKPTEAAVAGSGQR
ncbi:MAG TPA: DUF998 domain-containing protein [Candidatus Angelobacter sp.]|jgi:hypothetical protein|nr:DUF998 domain-containing protein [Candidatus Angelobacter sp.]